MLHHYAKQTYRRLPKQHRFILIALLSLTVLMLILPSDPAVASRPSSSEYKESDAPLSNRTAVPIPQDIVQTNATVIVAPEIKAKSTPKPLVQSSTEKSDAKDKAQSEVTAVKIDNELVQEALIESASSENTLTTATINLTEVQDALAPGQRYQIALNAALLADDQLPEFENVQDWKSFKVKNGDNLAKLFKRAGLTPQEVHYVSRAGKDAKRLLKMVPGDEIRLLKNENGQFEQLEYDFSNTKTLLVSKAENKYVSSINTKEVYSRLNYASGEIENSFWNAGVKAGLSDNQIMSLATIFGWDIDFALDIRQGDHFNVVYEENYIDGEFVGFGDIVAAEFSNQGEKFAAMRYTDGNYYTPEGKSMRKSFLRAPVNFKYISSNFKPRRFHPVLKRWKAHNGIDYAAKSGTPVVAAGDGKVIAATYNKYNGNYVFIQHGDTYVTKYLHFTKRAVKKGQWVKQGQVIGYVGKTGLATAPHLHYEFLVNGKHKNPRTVNLPKALPIAKKEKQAFLVIAGDYQKKLDMNRRIMLAMN